MDLAIAITERNPLEVTAISTSYYTTKPVGGPEQPDYLNAVCLLAESDLPALRFTISSPAWQLKKSLGRERIERLGTSNN